MYCLIIVRPICLREEKLNVLILVAMPMRPVKGVIKTFRPKPEIIKPYSVLMLNSVLRFRSHAQLIMHAHGGYETSRVRTQPEKI